MDAVIECRGLVKRYGKRSAVDGLDLTIPPGGIYGFLGPNGAGKSTTIRLILDLIRPNGGEIRVFGKSVRSERRAVLSRVGALVERPDFYEHLSGRRNLELLSSLSGRGGASRTGEVLEQVGLADRQHDRVAHYSHGMRQRLGLAQALLPRPELLILDEPANGLDPEGLVGVRNLLRRVADESGMTIFLSSHLLAEVEMLCTHVALVARGRLVMQGPVDELLGSCDSIVDIEVDDMTRAGEVVQKHLGATASTGNGRIGVHVPRPSVPLLNRALVEAGILVSSIVPRRANLEECYMAAMREAGDADANAR